MVEDGVYSDGRLWFALYELQIGTESGLSLWRSSTIDPAFIARPAQGSPRLEAGWYRARTALDKRGGEIRQPRLYLPDAQGHYSEARTVELSREGGFYQAEFFLPHSADHVRFDPRYQRPVESHPLVGDASKAHRVLGWKARTHALDLARLMVDADVAAL